MSRPTEAPSRFPYWVALGSLVFVLWLFFGSTVPALREQQELLDHAAEYRRLRHEFDAAIQEARLGVGPNAHYDLQALLVAIDQKNLTPHELCTLWPERAPLAPVEEQPAERPTVDPSGESAAPPPAVMR